MTTTRWKVRKQAGGPGKHAIETESGLDVFVMRGASDEVAAQVVHDHNRADTFDKMVEALEYGLASLARPNGADRPVANKIQAALRLAKEV